MRNNHLDKPHLCALGAGCVATAPGGTLGCPAHEAELTEEEHDAVYGAWMQPGFDVVVEAVIQKHLRRHFRAEPL